MNRVEVRASVALAVCAALYVPATVQAQESVGLEEIVVTATRRAESAQDVPVSVAVFGQEQMDAQGVKQIDDIARFSPSVQFGRGGGGFGSGLGNSISIRGMSATAGPATTGVYIDDTPVQVGNIIASGSFTDNAYPMLFDIERVEVLSGPQGTLFGSGSEGGAVRFIQPGPNMTKSSMYARTEVSGTTYGAPSYEAGVAGGAPIVEDKLGFRASIWSRHTGGIVDRVNYYTGNVENRDNNYSDALSARFALGWKPFDELTITPSFYYQRTKDNGAGGNAFYFPSDGIGDVMVNQPYGNPNKGDYVDLRALNQFGNQTLKLTALAIDWQLPHDMRLFSNTSYYQRTQDGLTDFASLEAAFWGGELWPADPAATFPGYDTQGNTFFTQEVRLQSTNDNARLKWLVGAFYQDNKTTDSRSVVDTYYNLSFFGTPLADGLYSFKGADVLIEKQKSLFGQADFNIVGGLSATVGLRYAKFDTDWTSYSAGPINGTIWPGPGGKPTTGKASADVTIPKFMFSYKADGSLTYISATKGFRNGGVNAPINNPACGPDLAALGLTAVPGSYGPDSLWSYELGTKLQFLDRRLIIDAAVYQYNWSDMIANQSLSQCTLSYTANIGTARGRGFEFSAQYRPIAPLTVGLNMGYHKLVSTQDVRATPTTANPLGALRIKDGSLISEGARLNANAQYNFVVGARDGYVRADYTYNDRPGFENDPDLASSYINDPRKIFLTPGYGLMNVRLGVNTGGWDISLFSNNLFNKQVLFTSRSTVGFIGIPTSVKQGTVNMPRTYGLTAVYRY
ncbi:MAG: TonB-dependent receptor [Steroidobacteraceae bacterium]